MKLTVPTVNIPFINRFIRLAGAYAAVLYPVISSIEGTKWGAKDSLLTSVGGVLLWIEHYNATPNIQTVVPPKPPVA